MKTIRYIFISLIGVLLISSCEKYLDKTPAAQVTDREIFSTYESFQGFIDPNYAEIMNYNTHYPCTTMNYGGEVYSYLPWASGYYGNTGDYWTYLAGTNYSDGGPCLYISKNQGNSWGNNATCGIWTGGWRGIRVCNLALRNMHYLTEATDEQRKLLLGQIYFFRAFFHQEIIAGFGGMPFVDSAFAATDELNMPRITYQACAERIVADYDEALKYLPEDWDQTAVGATRLGANTGRIVKGMALAYKQKVLLYAGSPLMNYYSGNDYIYNVELCKRAAAAGWEMIQLANKGLYKLVSFDNYYDNFSKRDGTIPWTTETIFQRMETRSGSTMSSYLRQSSIPPRIGGSEAVEGVNQTYVDKFEMADGSRYNPAYDSDDTKRWENRDPRFRKNIVVDRDQVGILPSTKVMLYTGAGSDKTQAAKLALPYLHKKYWRNGVNGVDAGGYTNLRIIDPLMRLAEVYLDYAEAVTAAYGPLGTAPGANITAVDAINIIRARAGMPPVTAAATGYANFMDLVRNERDVELCFEGHYWFDIRRWHIAHLQENKEIIDLQFDQAWTPSSFKRVLFYTRVFEDPKHYWLPLPRKMCMLYDGMYQNPGWQ